MSVPKYDDLFNPLLQALRALGGSGTNQEIEEKVAFIMKLTDKQANELHRGNRTKLEYRLAWSRNYLKRYGLIENSSRGVWSLTSMGRKTKKVNKAEVKRVVKYISKTAKDDKGVEKELREEEGWKQELMDIIMKIEPDEFERLCQRILREAGFFEVVVTGKTGDGGIDGIGKMRIGGFLSMKIVFQCKRHKSSISSKDIRDFRGAMSGRADKGLLITTSSFTRSAKEEADREGATPIDLVDSELLIEKMKELGLGVKIEKKEEVKIDKQWFDSF